MADVQRAEVQLGVGADLSGLEQFLNGLAILPEAIQSIFNELQGSSLGKTEAFETRGRALARAFVQGFQAELAGARVGGNEGLAGALTREIFGANQATTAYVSNLRLVGGILDELRGKNLPALTQPAFSAQAVQGLQAAIGSSNSATAALRELNAQLAQTELRLARLRGFQLSGREESRLLRTEPQGQIGVVPGVQRRLEAAGIPVPNLQELGSGQSLAANSRALSASLQAAQQREIERTQRQFSSISQQSLALAGTPERLALPVGARSGPGGEVDRLERILRRFESATFGPNGEVRGGVNDLGAGRRSIAPPFDIGQLNEQQLRVLAQTATGATARLPITSQRKLYDIPDAFQVSNGSSIGRLNERVQTRNLIAEDARAARRNQLEFDKLPLGEQAANLLAGRESTKKLLASGERVQAAYDERAKIEEAAVRARQSGKLDFSAPPLPRIPFNAPPPRFFAGAGGVADGPGSELVASEGVAARTRRLRRQSQDLREGRLDTLLIGLSGNDPLLGSAAAGQRALPPGSGRIVDSTASQVGPTIRTGPGPASAGKYAQLIAAGVPPATASLYTGYTPPPPPTAAGGGGSAGGRGAPLFNTGFTDESGRKFTDAERDAQAERNRARQRRSQRDRIEREETERFEREENFNRGRGFETNAGLRSSRASARESRRQEFLDPNTSFLGSIGQSFRGTTSGGFKESFREGFFGRTGDLAEQLGQTAKFSLLYGTAYSALFHFVEAIREGVTQAIQFQESLVTLSFATGRSTDSIQHLGNLFAGQATAAGFSGPEGVKVGASIIGAFGLADASKADQIRLGTQAHETAIQIAKVSDEKPEKVVNQLAGLSRVFNLPIPQLGKVGDAATFIGRQSGTSPHELLDAAAQIGEVAKNAGFSLNETLALISRVKTTTGQTPQAVAGQLGQIFARADQPRLEASLRAVGVDTFRTSLREQFLQLSTIHLTEEQGNLLKNQFGRGGRTGGAVLAALQGFPAVESLADRATNQSGGTLSKAFEEINRTVGGQLSIFVNSLHQLLSSLAQSGLLDVFGLVLAGAIPAVRALTDVANAFGEIPHAIRGVIEAVALLLLATRVRGALGGGAAATAGGAGLVEGVAGGGLLAAGGKVLRSGGGALGRLLAPLGLIAGLSEVAGDVNSGRKSAAQGGGFDLSKILKAGASGGLAGGSAGLLGGPLAELTVPVGAIGGAITGIIATSISQAIGGGGKPKATDPAAPAARGGLTDLLLGPLAGAPGVPKTKNVSSSSGSLTSLLTGLTDQRVKNLLAIQKAVSTEAAAFNDFGGGQTVATAITELQHRGLTGPNIGKAFLEAAKAAQQAKLLTGEALREFVAGVSAVANAVATDTTTLTGNPLTGAKAGLTLTDQAIAQAKAGGATAKDLAALGLSRRSQQDQVNSVDASQTAARTGLGVARLRPDDVAARLKLQIDGLRRQRGDTRDPAAQAQLDTQIADLQTQATAETLAKRVASLTNDPRATNDRLRSLRNQREIGAATLTGLTAGSSQYVTQLAQNALLDKQITEQRIKVGQAQRRANSDPTSSLSTATNDFKDARENLARTTRGTEEYFAALTSYSQTAVALAQQARKLAASQRDARSDLTNPVVVARNALKDARDKLKDDRARHAGADVLADDTVNVRGAQNQSEAAAFNQRFSDAQTAEQLGRLSHSAYLSYLRSEHDRLTVVKHRTRQQTEELNQIDGAIKSAGDQLSGQFNIGDIRIPTIYEVRRSIGASNAGIGYQDNRTVTITVDGGNPQHVLGVIDKYLGSNIAQGQTRSGTRLSKTA